MQTDSWLPAGLGGEGVVTLANSTQRSAEMKHSEIVEYLKKIPRDAKATFVDLKKELDIDLDYENYVLDMVKSNPKIECERSSEDVMFFKYRAKFEIRDRNELLREIERVKNGISMKDITDPECYPGVGT